MLPLRVSVNDNPFDLIQNRIRAPSWVHLCGCGTRCRLMSERFNSAATIGHRSSTLFTSGLQLETSFRRALDTLSDLERNFHTSPNIHLPTELGSQKGLPLFAVGAETINTARITKARGLFSMWCGVELNIRAPAARIWHLLTDASGFPSWNSTVTRVEGQIRGGEQLRLHVPGTDRTFTPRVSGVVPNGRMTWTGGFSPLFKGVRTFELRPCDDGSTDFVMEEHF
jgi:hypothetical protein